MYKVKGESTNLQIFAGANMPMEKHNKILVTSHRFASYSHLMAFWRQIESATHNIVRVTRATGGTAKADEVTLPVKVMILQPIDEFFSLHELFVFGSDAEGSCPQIQNPPINSKPNNKHMGKLSIHCTGCCGYLVG